MRRFHSFGGANRFEFRPQKSINQRGSAPTFGNIFQSRILGCLIGKPWRFPEIFLREGFEVRGRPDAGAGMETSDSLDALEPRAPIDIDDSRLDGGGV